MAKTKKDKELSQEEVSELATLVANYEMFNNTIEEARLRGRKTSVEQLKVAQDEVLERIETISPSKAKELTSKQTTLVVDSTNQDMYGTYEENEPEWGAKDYAEMVENDEVNIKDVEVNNIDRDIAYDVIPLPSNGECYSEKIERIPVGYLTAYDENLITSPNLYKDGLVIDFLLKHKVMNKDIDIDELCCGDADAIILFLRATSYGTDFPITVQDPLTKQTIETVVDLSTLKYKPFNLKGDENGHFLYTLPISQDVIKFKFLTRKDEKALRRLSKLETNSMKAMTMAESLSILMEGVKSDTILDPKDRLECIKQLQNMEQWVSRMRQERGLSYSKLVTNRLELSIVSVNGNTDREYIRKYIRTMIAKDSLELRRHIIANEPGVDFEIEVQRPESLGGGSFKTFLEWDDSVFINIA